MIHQVMKVSLVRHPEIPGRREITLTHTCVTLYLHKEMIGNPRRREGAHTHTNAFLQFFHKELIRNPGRREEPSHTFLIFSKRNNEESREEAG